ncbi:peptidase [Ktedonobacteria bacterium brp13]|nr:peptidase [Ktedonobacteria bacterium brp13]
MSLYLLRSGLRGRRYSSSSTTQPYGRIITIITPLLSLTFLMYMVSFQLLHFTFVRATNSGEPLPLTGTLTPLLSRSHFVGQADPQQQLLLSMGLKPSNTDTVELALKHISYGGNTIHSLENFRPTQVSYARVTHYLKDAGFTVTRTYSHRLYINFHGTVAQVETLFHTPINIYRAPSGPLFYANSQDPLLPEWLHAEVVGLYGLNNATHWHHTIEEDQGSSSPTSPAVLLSTARTCPRANGRTLTPQQVASAYGLDTLYRQHDQGEGQDIALFELDGIHYNDIATYAHCFGIPTNNLITMPSEGINQAPGVDARGSESDAELLLSAVPHLHSLELYETNNDESSYLSQWARIIEDDVPVVTTGWNICELQAEDQLIQQENVFFEMAALQGQNIFAAAGSSSCIHNNTRTGQLTMTGTDPAAQPYIISVGGSNLITSGTTYDKEIAWLPSTTNNKTATVSSNSNLSSHWSPPTWQHMFGITNQELYAARPIYHCLHGACRAIPDVAFNADPFTGYWTYCSVAVAGCTPGQQWQSVGGTSVAALYWSAFMALTNELAQHQTVPRPGFVAPLLYTLADNPVSYAHDFHDIVVNDASGLSDIGYDHLTGLGSYRAWNLAHALIQQANAGSREHNQVQLSMGH